MIILICVIVVLIVLVGMYFTYNNKEVSLRKEINAQRGKIESVHDKMWKVIQQKAEVSEQYRETFEKIYPELISGRYANDGNNAMKWIQEANPDFDTSLYKDLQQAIEIQRELRHACLMPLRNVRPCWNSIRRSGLSRIKKRSNMR